MTLAEEMKQVEGCFFLPVQNAVTLMDHVIAWRLDQIQVQTESGHKGIMAHAKSDGTFERLDPDRAQPLDFVICCFPKQVKQRYPSLNVLGDWDSPTMTTGVKRYTPRDVLIVEGLVVGQSCCFPNARASIVSERIAEMLGSGRESADKEE